MGLLQLFLLSLISIASLQHCMAQLNDDVLGLIVFKSNLNDPSSYLESWNEDDNSPCSWNFVQCNPLTKRVSELSLNGLGLSGKIGRGLEKLQSLKVLSLSHNNFTGTITPALAFITSLQSLNLSHNSLSGRMPTSIASSIKFLDLSNNTLSGPLPDSFFQNCSSLRYLSLASNFLEAQIPSTLSKCTSLSNLNLSNNHFSGNPDFITGIWSLTRLRTLDLSHNELSGSVPEGLSAIHNLKEFRLRGNHFSGQIPFDIGLCPHLNRIDFSDNRFAGELPNSLQRLDSLTFFSLSNNMFTGELPQWIGNMSSLEYIDFSGNGFTGNIPISLVYCTKLSVIKLKGNSFNGSVPDVLFDLGLEELDFSQNGLTGSIPPGSSALFDSLRILDLSSNKLMGNIPAEMGLFSNLRYLNLSWNSFWSRLPPELGYFQNLTVLDLRNSALFGSIPGDLCDSRSLSILQLDGNSLTGPIPGEIGNCSSLYLLSLSHNNLSGSIPKSISMLSKLEILKLDYNELTGEIPQEFGRLENLLAVNISYNRLTGRLPVGGIFQSLDKSALQGNLGICSPLLKGPCVMNVQKPLVFDPDIYNPLGHGHRQRNESSNYSSIKFRHHNFLSVSAIVAISAAVLIALGVIMISLLNISIRKRLAFVDHALESMCSSSSRSGNATAAGKLILFDSNSLSQDWSISNPESLLNKAAEIGCGVFGMVYKVPLGMEDPQVVPQSASHAWCSFIEQVDSICVSTSLMVLATSEVPYTLLPLRIRQFFKGDISKCSQSTPSRHTVPRFSVMVDGNFNRDIVINSSAAKLSRDVIRQFVQLIHHRHHIHTSSCREYKTSNTNEGNTVVECRNTAHESANENDGITQFPEDSMKKVPPPPCNRTVKGKSSLVLAISTFGYQILLYPQFAELCWVTSKLKSGPCADINGPWKGWPFNSCIVRPYNSLEKIAVACSSSNIKIKENSGLVRGLIAVGLSAYRGVYESLREVSLEVRKVLELLVGQINVKIQAGKDKYQFVRLLSQVAFLEDMVNSWAYTLQSFEADVQVMVPNPKLATEETSDIHGTDVDHLVRSGKCKPNVSNRTSRETGILEECSGGIAAEIVDSVELRNGNGDFGHPISEERVAMPEECLAQAVVVGHSIRDIHQNAPVADDGVDGKILNVQNGSLKHLKDSNGSVKESTLLSEESLCRSGELVGVKSSSFKVCKAINGFSLMEVGNPSDHGTHNPIEHIVSSNKATDLSDDTGVVCLYRCCTECLYALHSLMQNVLMHEWGLHGSFQTIDDVHDFVASISVNILSAFTEDKARESFRYSFDKNTGHGNHGKLFENQEFGACECKTSESRLFMPMKCSCHITGESLTVRENSSKPPQLDTQLIYRDGVLAPVDPGKDVSFHCKFETLCLCSLIEWVTMIKQPLD